MQEIYYPIKLKYVIANFCDLDIQVCNFLNMEIQKCISWVKKEIATVVEKEILQSAKVKSNQVTAQGFRKRIQSVHISRAIVRAGATSAIKPVAFWKHCIL